MPDLGGGGGGLHSRGGSMMSVEANTFPAITQNLCRIHTQFKVVDKSLKTLGRQVYDLIRSPRKHGPDKNNEIKTDRTSRLSKFACAED